jgi:CRP-like cAMP-binding protein
MSLEEHKLLIKEKLESALPEPNELLVNDYLNILEIRKIKKKQFIGQPGFARIHETYVVKGAFRTFFIDNSGNEQTTQFAIDDWYINDSTSYITGEPATLYIEALEDSIIADIPKQKFEALCDTYPALQKLYRMAAQGGYAYAQKRMIANLQKSAEERYLDFNRNYALIEQRVPQHALASYLNMSQEYLSKIRSKLAKK